MRGLLPILFFLISQVDSNAQRPADSDLLKIFGYTFIDKHNGLLYSGIDSVTLNGVRNYLKGEKIKGRNGQRLLEPSEVLKLDKSERAYLDSQLVAVKNYRWTKAAIEKCGIFHLQIVGEEIYTKRSKIEQYVYEIMQPIFIRDSTICFTFNYIYCFGLCGTGEILFTEKQMINGFLGFR